MISIFELQAVSDLYLPEVFYVIHENAKVARISKHPYGWKVWYYTDKYGILRNKLSDALEAAERHYYKRKNEISAGITGKVY